MTRERASELLREQGHNAGGTCEKCWSDARAQDSAEPISVTYRDVLERAHAQAEREAAALGDSA